ncbi:MAG: SAM-dependent MidA family methyltransferase [Ilumatobacter sp.]
MVGGTVVEGAIVVVDAGNVVAGTVFSDAATVDVVVAAVVAATSAVVNDVNGAWSAVVEIDARVSPPAGAPGTAALLAGSAPQATNSTATALNNPTLRRLLTPTACLTETPCIPRLTKSERIPTRADDCDGFPATLDPVVPFDEFMRDALYGEAGFYTKPNGGHAGRRGDFLTSPEVGPLFGAVVANYLDAVWKRIGEPTEFTVVDAGAGPGTLARSIAAAKPRCFEAMRYVAVELSGGQRDRHPAGIESTASMPAEPFDGVVIANELLDNLPFRLAVFDDGWREAYIDREADGSLTERLSAPFDPTPAQLLQTATLGARVPLIEQAREWIESARQLVRNGTVLAIDYGVPLTAELAQRPWRDWLRTYRGNERGEHYLAAPGTQDITTDVPFDQLPEPDALRSQAQFLQLWGIDDLVNEGKRIWDEQAARPGLEAMKMRSRVSESEALLDPSGLGSFLVAEWRA